MKGKSSLLLPVCLPLLPAVKVWEISSLLCSRNCARKAAVSVAYTILYIAPYGHIETGNSNQIKLKNKRRIMEKKEMYLAPEIEVLEVEVEKGFAGSVPGDLEDGDMPVIPGQDW